MAVLGGCLLIIIIASLSALLGGWVLMLLVGALWHEFGWLQPIGYWPSVGIAFCLSFISGMIFGRTRT